MQLHIGEFASALDGHKEIELALGGLYLGDVDVQGSDRIGFELLANRLAAEPNRAVFPYTSFFLGITFQFSHRCLWKS